jgi:hypothetical protein
MPLGFKINKSFMKDPKKEIRDYLEKLIHRLLYIKGLNKQLKLLREWETPNRIIALEIGSYFFRLVGFSFYRTLLIELCMLFDDREEKCINDFLLKANENVKAIEPKRLNSKSGKREIIKSSEYQNVIAEHQKLINSKRNIIDNIKGRRDTNLAHSDAKYFNNPNDIYIKYPLRDENIEDIIELATEILRMQHVYLFDSDLDIQVYTTSNIDTILWHIRGFNRVWFDKRATELHPGLYKLDDYEERLKGLQNKNNKA